MKLLLKNINVNCNRDEGVEEGKQNFKNVNKSKSFKTMYECV